MFEQIHLQEIHQRNWAVPIAVLTGLALAGAAIFHAVPHVQWVAQHKIAIKVDKHGFYYTKARANRRHTTNCEVDSGAESITIPKAEAEAAGLLGLVYDDTTSTAGGDAKMAHSTLRELQVGDLVLKEVKVVIIDSDLDFCLLGVPFLRKFSEVQIKDGTMSLFY